MKVRIRTDDGKRIEVDVSDRCCPKRPCFGWHKWQVRSTTCSGSKSAGSQSYWSCPHRNYHGCPMPKPEVTP